MKVLSKPHPFIFNAWSIGIPGAVTIVVILLLAPLGFDDLTLKIRAVYSVLFGLIASLVVGLCGWLIQSVTPKRIREDEWTVGKEIAMILSIISIICLVNYKIVLLISMDDFEDLPSLLQVVGYTLSISFFPVLLMIFTEQFFYRQAILKESETLNSARKSTPQKDQAHTHLTGKQFELKSESGLVELSVHLNQILFFQSDGNYVEIFYSDKNNVTQKKLIRNRLKYFNKELPATIFFHCHKRYIVNLNKVYTVTGNARNFELILNDQQTRIPVSRAKALALKKQFIDG